MSHRDEGCPMSSFSVSTGPREVVSFFFFLSDTDEIVKVETL